MNANKKISLIIGISNVGTTQFFVIKFLHKCLILYCMLSLI